MGSNSKCGALQAKAATWFLRSPTLHLYVSYSGRPFIISNLGKTCSQTLKQ